MSQKAHTARSPLRYPGGKTRAVATLRQYIPEGTDTLVSPFLGGGSFELACAADGITVYGYDAFDALIGFWRQTHESPLSVSHVAQRLYPLSREKFYFLQKRTACMQNTIERAGYFFVLNRSSFSGTTLSGGMSKGHPRFTQSSIDRLKNHHAPNLHVACADFKDTMARHPGDLLYLDPPYANGGRLYGIRGDRHAGFDHEGLADLLRERTGWILSYNDHPDVRKMYEGFEFQTPGWRYGMSNDKASNELLILNL